MIKIEIQTLNNNQFNNFVTISAKANYVCMHDTGIGLFAK